ncbi:MAG: xanthine dehydrogenase accessory protein XdhC [Cereibacter sphaeroides]|uniref:Xanthine dehydrogenase accessory protein XdhC n=1 Tax=Cereibacter sphaeroides TaxID=1063 RepID=A0A2W5UBH3_CERSP|nr:MAG: xanthine dehydrogenase accessory protein XdhC [Cereibacter sphaeroides]
MFDLCALSSAVATHGSVARIVVAETGGSCPRETGTAMLVWADGISGTIGGGALEWEAIARARALLPEGKIRLDRVPLGPALGQCCGGSVTLLTEVYDAGNLPTGEVIARSVDGRDMPLALSRLLARARNQGVAPAPQLVQGWMVEPVARPARQLWIWGAGHVGRALVNVLSPLPDFAITWVDVAADRFPEAIPDSVTMLPAADPAALVAHAPREAEHLILTFSHALDLELCHRLLAHGFAGAGLIGSDTKWARFRSRLAALGHTPAAIARIDCPIGDTALGKHPQAIAVGVAAQLLRRQSVIARPQENTG